MVMVVCFYQALLGILEHQGLFCLEMRFLDPFPSMLLSLPPLCLGLVLGAEGSCPSSPTDCQLHAVCSAPQIFVLLLDLNFNSIRVLLVKGRARMDRKSAKAGVMTSRNTQIYRTFTLLACFIITSRHASLKLLLHVSENVL